MVPVPATNDTDKTPKAPASGVLSCLDCFASHAATHSTIAEFAVQRRIQNPALWAGGARYALDQSTNGVRRFKVSADGTRSC